MLLADTIVPVVPVTAVVSTLDGVTTVLAGFVFVCMAMPTLVRNRPQFYAGMGAVVGIILVHTLSLMFSTSAGFLNFSAVVTGVLQAGGLLLLVLSVGGLTAKELAGDMSKAYEVMRRGETTKETIIPIGDQARPAAASKVYRVDPPAAASPAVEDDDDIKLK